MLGVLRVVFARISWLREPASHELETHCKTEGAWQALTVAGVCRVLLVAAVFRAAADVPQLRGVSRVPDVRRVLISTRGRAN